MNYFLHAVCITKLVLPLLSDTDVEVIEKYHAEKKVHKDKEIKSAVLICYTVFM